MATGKGGGFSNYDKEALLDSRKKYYKIKAEQCPNDFTKREGVGKC